MILNFMVKSFFHSFQLRFINAGTFTNCPLTSFRIPKHLEIYIFIGEAFSRTHISTFTTEDECENYAVYQGSLYSKDYKNLYIHHKGDICTIH